VPNTSKNEALEFFEATKSNIHCLDNHPLFDRVGTYLFPAELSKKEA
jgi:hypothetical protein